MQITHLIDDYKTIPTTNTEYICRFTCVRSQQMEEITPTTNWGWRDCTTTRSQRQVQHTTDFCKYRGGFAVHFKIKNLVTVFL